MIKTRSYPSRRGPAEASPIRTHGRLFVCTRCAASIPIPETGVPGEAHYDQLGAVFDAFAAAHLDCTPPEPSYVSAAGVRVYDRRWRGKLIEAALQHLAPQG